MSIKYYNIFVKNIKNKTTFSKNLTRLRKQRGLAQKELANLSGVSQRMIVYYECEGGNPPLNKIKNLADALKVDIKELLLDNNNKQKSSTSNIDFIDINIKTLKRIKQLLALTPEKRHVVYALIDSLSKEN
jgi:transcriptional regulator with XRE-family HTH domain